MTGFVLSGRRPLIGRTGSSPHPRQIRARGATVNAVDPDVEGWMAAKRGPAQRRDGHPPNSAQGRRTRTVLSDHAPRVFG